MNKKLKNSFYQTEYSSSFGWKKDDHSNRTTTSSHVKKDIQNQGSRSSGLNDKKFHQFRHRLKLALLEKLENLESEYEMNTSSSMDHVAMNSLRPTPKKTVNMKKPTLPSDQASPKNLKKHNHMRPKNLSSVALELWNSELKRSRSMAMEFKQKNESTQIWWLNEYPQNSSEEDISQKNLYFYPKVSCRPLIKTSLIQVPRTVHNIKNYPRRGSFISNKISTTDPSQSTFSRSSYSYHIAQATGYQSTTDEFSSFNHDTDGKSVDHTNAKSWYANNYSIKQEIKGVPKLEMPLSLIDNNKSLLFYPPYQKEDFIPDSASSEPNSPQNFDTYRLD